MAGTSSFRIARHSAFEAQGGACYYCQRLMWRGWVERPEAFAAHMGITVSEAHKWQCTGDHMVPKSVGPKRGPLKTSRRENIVAACRGCNDAKAALTPDEWKPPQRPAAKERDENAKAAR